MVQTVPWATPKRCPIVQYSAQVPRHHNVTANRHSTAIGVLKRVSSYCITDLSCVHKYTWFIQKFSLQSVWVNAFRTILSQKWPDLWQPSLVCESWCACVYVFKLCLYSIIMFDCLSRKSPNIARTRNKGGSDCCSNSTLQHKSGLSMELLLPYLTKSSCACCCLLLKELWEELENKW